MGWYVDISLLDMRLQVLCVHACRIDWGNPVYTASLRLPNERPYDEHKVRGFYRLISYAEVALQWRIYAPDCMNRAKIPISLTFKAC